MPTLVAEKQQLNQAAEGSKVPLDASFALHELTAAKSGSVSGALENVLRLTKSANKYSRTHGASRVKVKDKESFTRHMLASCRHLMFTYVA